MDIFNVLTYLNKLSLLAFFITAAILIYQVIIMKKEHSQKNAKPVIPNFNENMAVPLKNFTAINEEKIVHKTQPMPKAILYTIIGITLICLVSVIYLINRKVQLADIDDTVVQTEKVTPTLITRQIISPTISIRLLSPTVTIPLPSPTVTISSTISPTSIQIVPTRVPTSLNKEVVVAYISPTALLTKAANVTAGREKTLPLTGTIENTVVIGTVSGFLIMLAFVF